MQRDKPVKLKQVRIIRDKETERIIDLKQMPNSSYTSKNNAEAFILKREIALKISKLKK